MKRSSWRCCRSSDQHKEVLVGRLALVVSIALSLAILVACGGEEKSSSGPDTASPSSVSGEKLQNSLKSMTLALDDLPAGFTLEDEGFTTNEEASRRQEMEPPEQWLARANEQGRLLGYEAT